MIDTYKQEKIEQFIEYRKCYFSPKTLELIKNWLENLSPRTADTNIDMKEQSLIHIYKLLIENSDYILCSHSILKDIEKYKETKDYDLLFELWMKNENYQYSLFDLYSFDEEVIKKHLKSWEDKHNNNIKKCLDNIKIYQYIIETIDTK